MRSKPEIRNSKLETNSNEDWGRRIMQFCLVYGPPHCFKRWEPGRMQDYLLHHLLHRTIAVQMSGRQVNGVMVAWEDCVDDIEAEAEAGEHPFRWEPGNVGGDCIFISECVARSRAVVPELLECFKRRFPEWAGRAWLGYRHGRLVRLDRMGRGLGITRTIKIKITKGN